MSAVLAVCSNGDQHYGHLDACGPMPSTDDGIRLGWWAVTGGYRVEQIIYIDTNPRVLDQGGTGRHPRPASPPGDHGAISQTALSSPALVVPSSAVPAEDASTTHTREEAEGSGAAGPEATSSKGFLATGTSAGTTGCICGHSRTWHSAYRVCRHPGCLCDRYCTPRKNDAAGT